MPRKTKRLYLLQKYREERALKATIRKTFEFLDLPVPKDSKKIALEIMPAEVRFTEAHTKFIAEFYVEHYSVMRGNGTSTASLNRERSQLLSQLAQELNTRFGKTFTTRQVHVKLKNLKRKAKHQLQDARCGLISIDGEAPDLPQLTEAEALIVSKLAAEGSSMEEAALMEERDSPSPSSDADDPHFDHPAPVQPIIPPGQPRFPPARARIPPVQPRIPPQQQTQQRNHVSPTTRPLAHGPATVSSPQRRVRVLLPSARSAGFARHQRMSNGSNQANNVKDLKKSVLLLQRQVLERDLQLQEEKRASMAKFNQAIDEFRRHVAEQRLVARGINIGDIPVDIPPGLEGLPFE